MAVSDTTLDLDSRRRASLGSLFDESVTDLIAHRFEDGSDMLEPASVVSRLEQRVQSDSTPSMRPDRPRHPRPRRRSTSGAPCGAPPCVERWLTTGSPSKPRLSTNSISRPEPLADLGRHRRRDPRCGGDPVRSQHGRAGSRTRHASPYQCARRKVSGSALAPRDRPVGFEGLAAGEVYIIYFGPLPG